MKWLCNGKLVNHSDSKYRIDFDKPSKSKAQFQVKQFLRQFCQNHVMYEEYRLPRVLLYVDFLNATNKFAIEYQGVGHETYNSHFHRGSPANFLGSIKRDFKKRKILEDNGYLVIELYPNDLPLLSRNFFKEKFGISL